MISSITGRDTVAIEDTVHEIYKQLTEGNDVVSVPFRTMKDLFMWAVCLGYQQNKRRSLTGKKQTIFRWAQFSPQIDIPILKAIAIADKGDVSVLLSQEEILSIAEEYANAGIYDLRDNVLDPYGQPLWNLVDMISQSNR
jgi:dnd system-associated protein 4